MKPRRLGRGLDFLLTSASEPTQEQAGIEEIELDKIESNPWQPRTKFGDDELQSLAESIRRHGVVQPIVVRRLQEGRFQLVAGERRLVASKKAGLSRIPALVRRLDDSEMLIVALVENVQRSDLGSLERARAFKRLVEEQGLTHDQVSEAAGLARSTVSNSLRLLDLDPISMSALESGTISEGHARALLSEPDEARRAALLDRMINEKMSVRTTEEVSSLGRVKSPASKRHRDSADARALEMRLAEALGLRTKIEELGVGGRVVIRYSNLEEFDRLFSRLVGKLPDELEEAAGA